MAAIISCNYFFPPHSKQSTNLYTSFAFPRKISFAPRCCSKILPPVQIQDKQKDRLFPIKECAISIALAIGLVTAVPSLSWPSYANANTSLLLDLAVLISGQPVKDPGALLRYSLPIDNKAIRGVQKSLEDITDSQDLWTQGS